MEKGKMVCGCSPTLQDEKMKRILAVAVCGGVYDENIVKNKVKRVMFMRNRSLFVLQRRMNTRFAACERKLTEGDTIYAEIGN